MNTLTIHYKSCGSKITTIDRDEHSTSHNVYAIHLCNIVYQEDLKDAIANLKALLPLLPEFATNRKATDSQLLDITQGMFSHQGYPYDAVIAHNIDCQRRMYQFISYLQSGLQDFPCRQEAA